jgi:hypothetical protein
MGAIGGGVLGGDWYNRRSALVRDTGDGGYVKRFVSMDSRTLKLAQFNPRKILEFPRANVVSVHRSIMGGDG